MSQAQNKFVDPYDLQGELRKANALKPVLPPPAQVSIVNCSHKFSELKYTEEGPYQTSLVTVKGGAEMKLHYCEKCGVVVVKPIVRAIMG